MENLRSYKENGYNNNYVVVINRTRFEFCGTFATRKAAENYNWNKLDGNGEVLTFRQAARKFPEYFKY